MSEVLHANVFFFITGVAVILFTALLCVALVHVIKLLKSLRNIVAHIEEGTEVLSEDMQQIRMHMVGGGVLRKLLHFLFGSKSDVADDTDTDEDTAHTRGSTNKKRSTLKIKDKS